MSLIDEDLTRIDAFDYDLPDERIAKYPLSRRDQSKLLLWKNGAVDETEFYNLAQHIPENSHLIYNNTRVIHARILFQKVTGAHIEVFCLEPLEPSDYALSLGSAGACTWKCLVGNVKKWKGEKLIREINNGGTSIKLAAELLLREGETSRVRFSWDDDTVTFSEILMQTGELPIPPYLHRPAEELDKTTYQTMYSQIEGSVAAPTAGLHFTPEVMASLGTRGITTDKLTLHVGAGTFHPVKTEVVEAHTMHAETFLITRSVIEQLLTKKQSIIAVGTTTVRTLESLYYIGKFILQNRIQPGAKQRFKVEQWDPYRSEGAVISTEESLQIILNYLDRSELEYLEGETQILIKPGFRFRIIHGMITNFHQPKSTLLLLVSAFVGTDWKKIYTYAMEHEFRFLSYGDSSLLLKEY